MKTISYLIFVFLFTNTFAQNSKLLHLNGQSVSIDSIDNKISQMLEAEKIQGLSLAVLNHGRTVFMKSYGFSNIYLNTKLDTSTIMYGASFSKAVFGFLTMKLVEDGILNLDKPLIQYLRKPIHSYDYFSDLKGEKYFQLITARMCLSHTTGLPNIRWFNPITSEEDTTGILKIYFKPGTKYAYSGEGFKLLQLVVEELTKMPLDSLAIKYIFKPLGMKRTGFVWHDDFEENNIAVGHLNNGLIDKKRKRTEAVAGGSLVTTISDYAKFIEFILKQNKNASIIFKEMISPSVKIYSKTQFPPITFETTKENDSIHLSYGLGWGLITCGDKKAIFKEGNGGSWRNYNINFIQDGHAVIILSNSENGEKAFQGIIEAVLGKTCIPWKWHGYNQQ